MCLQNLNFKLYIFNHIQSNFSNAKGIKDNAVNKVDE